jgi:hypothetical protein
MKDLSDIADEQLATMMPIYEHMGLTLEQKMRCAFMAGYHHAFPTLEDKRRYLAWMEAQATSDIRG